MRDNTITYTLNKAPLAWAIAGLLPLGAAVAEEQQSGWALEEITVTAQKRPESLQDAPISIMAFSNEKLEQMGVSDVMDMQGAVPNVTFTPFPQNKNSATTYIRGVGNADIQVTKDSAVGMYLDGVYLGRSAGLALDIADLEQIEVLRGPQGTLYGRNSTGGAVNMSSVKPSAENSFSQTLSVGNQGYWRSLTKGNYAVTDTLFVRGAYAISEKDGWVENSAIGGDFGADDKEALRVAVRWEPNEAWVLDYAYDQSSNTSVQLPYQLVADGTGSLGFLVREKRQDTLSVNRMQDTEVDVNGHALTVEWSDGNHVVKSITAYRELDEAGYQDYSPSWHHFGGGLIPALVSSGVEYLDTTFTKEQEQFSQEFQFIGELYDGRLQYTAGLYYFQEEGAEYQETNLNLLRLLSFDFDGTPPVLDSFSQADLTAWALWNSAEEVYDVDVESESFAIYGQYAYTPALLEDNLTLTLGLRYTEDERRASKTDNLYNGFAGGTVTGDRDSENFSISLTADYAINDDVNVYAKYAEGYRAGGFNTRGSQANFAAGFEPEAMTAYELGLKSELLDRRVRLNAAVFNYTYDELQVDQSDPTNITQTDTFNAGKATYNGFEFDLTAMLNEHLTLNASYGYVNAEYDEFFQFGVDVSNERRIAFTPENSYSLAVDYDTRWGTIGDLNVNLAYSWQDEQWFSSRGDAIKDDLGLLNASVSLTDVSVGAGNLRTTLWIHNLEDKEYVMHSFDAGGLVLGVFGEERTYGLDVTLEF